MRGPKHVVKKGKTPVLDGDEAKKLIDSIDVSTVVGLRDRALIALLIYSFARISAALHMNVEDYYPQGKRWWVRLHEKGGKQHEMPAHHLLRRHTNWVAASQSSRILGPEQGPLGGNASSVISTDRPLSQAIAKSARALWAAMSAAYWLANRRGIWSMPHSCVAHK